MQFIGLISSSRRTKESVIWQTISNAIALYESMPTDWLVKVVRMSRDITRAEVLFQRETPETRAAPRVVSNRASSVRGDSSRMIDSVRGESLRNLFQDGETPIDPRGPQTQDGHVSGRLEIPPEVFAALQQMNDWRRASCASESY